MIVLISIDRSYDNYTEFSNILQEIEKRDQFKEFCCVKNELVERYRSEYHSPVNIININWSDFSSISSKADIKQNKSGKNYNALAPMIAAKNACKYSTHYVEFGKGDYSISQLVKNGGEFDLTKIESSKKNLTESKKYNF